MSKELHSWWLCFCVVSSLISITSVKSSSENCKQHNDTQHLTYHCGNQINDDQIIIKISTNEKMIEINCSTYDKPDYIKLINEGINKTITFTQLVISQCPLPDASFCEFSRIFNTSSVKTLSFRSTTESAADFESCHFKNLDSVEILNLEANMVTLPEHIFDQMLNLTDLNLADNRLRSLPVKLFEPLKKLRKLNLRNNNFTTLDGNVLRYAPTLTFLNLCGNSLNKISTSVFESLTNLTTLEICNNSITYLENDVFGNSQLLEEINLSNNKLANLSGNLFDKCANLKILKLSGNLLKILPDSIFKLNSNLVKLDISSNRLQNLSQAVFDPLTKLSTLRLDENQIISIDRDPFYSLASLTELNLSKNGMKNISSRAFLNLIHLETLDLSFNELTLEEAKIGKLSPFIACSNLRYLRLRKNLLTRVFTDWRRLLNNLTELDLSFNKLENLTAADFIFNSINATINYSNNPLNVIDLDELEQKAQPPCNPSDFFIKNFNEKISSQKNNFILENSEIRCDCSALILAKYFQKNINPAVFHLANISINRITCRSPKAMENISLGKVNLTELKCPLKELHPEEAKNCPEGCDCHYRSFDHANVVNCTDTNMDKFPEKIPIVGNTKIELIFSKNKLKSVEGLSKLSMVGNVTTISLSHNELQTIDDLQLPNTIEVLNLDNNRISHLNKNILDFIKSKNTSLRNVSLHGNPWECNCETLEFQNYLRYHRPTLWFDYRPEIRCRKDNESVTDKWEEKLCPSPFVIITKYLGILGLISIPSIILYYRFKQRIKMWMFTHKICLWLVTEKEIDKDKLYDAFVSFSHKDQHFVDHQLIPELEENGEHTFKLCVHHRDFVIGEYIPDQIIYSVENSRRTIIILTPNFLKSIWARMEFRTAYLRAIKERCARVIVILLEDVNNDELDPELKAYISMNTYVKWGDSDFWQKLRYALPHPPIKHKKKRSRAARIFQEIEMREVSKD